MDTRIIDRVYYKVLAMALEKKFILDQNCQELLEPLKSVGMNRVYTIQKLGFDAQSETKDSVLHKRLKAVGGQTPRSGFLFITKNAKHFKNPDGYDILWIPDKINTREFVESFKQWVINLRKPAQKVVYQAVKTREKTGRPYSFEPRLLKNS